MRISLTGIVFLLLWTVTGYSQSAGCPCHDLNNTNTYVPDLIAKEFMDQHIGDLLQFQADWEESDIYLVTGDSVKGEYVRYSSLLDEMLWMRKDDYQKAILDRRFIKEIVIYNDLGIGQRFVKVKIKNNLHIKNSDTYMQILVEGNTSFLKQYITIEQSYSGEMFKKVNYFLHINDIYVQCSLKRSSFLKAFGEDKKQIKQILRSNHLSPNRESDLAKAVELYNRML